MGYARVRDFDGGVSEWTRSGLPVESGEMPVRSPRSAIASRPELARAMSALRWVSRRSIGELLASWLVINLSFGILYWLVSFLPGHGLREQGQLLGHGAAELLEAIYFSFVTGLSIGFGDIVPEGSVRLLAIVEGASCLLIFGALISRLVSGRQEELTEEIHRIAFEGRLGRVRTNLHLVVGEIQGLAETCRDGQAPSEAILTRIESAAAVFSGEIRAIHDLLHRPQLEPGEEVLESILAHLDGGLREFVALVACLDAEHRASPALATNLRAMAGLAEEICGECVPREYAPHLKVWMDRIQARARALRGPAM